MAHVTWAVRARQGIYGVAQYERETRAALMGIGRSDWSFEELRIGGARAKRGERDRIWSDALAERMPFPLVSLAGRLLYRRRGLLHRWDVRLPPAGGDVVTVHDAAPLRFADEGGVPPWIRLSARHAAGAICVSRFSAQEASEVFGVRRTWIAYPGVSERFLAAGPLDHRALAELGLRQPFFMHLGGVSKRKNFPALAAAWRAVEAQRPEAQLVMTGPVSEQRRGLVADSRRAVFLGHLDDAILPRLLASAAAAVVPSIYEGFGLPALEAMAAGTAVIAADRASLPEVVGDAGVLTEPDAEAMAEAMLRVIDDVAFRNELARRGRQRARSFTWTRTAEQHLEAYAEALDC